MSKRPKPKKRQVPAWPADPKTDPMYPFGGPPPLEPAEPDSIPKKPKNPTWGQLKKEYR